MIDPPPDPHEASGELIVAERRLKDAQDALAAARKCGTWGSYKPRDETAKDAVRDIDGAIERLRRRLGKLISAAAHTPRHGRLTLKERQE